MVAVIEKREETPDRCIEALSNLHNQLHQSAAEYYEEINFTNLSSIEQERLTLGLLEMLHGLEFRHFSYERQRRSWEVVPSEEININPRIVRVKITGKEEITFGASKERMLAFFTALTGAKIYRGLWPLITRSELSSVADVYKIEQLTDHLLTPLKNAGILEVNYGEGFWLACAPSEIWRILKGNESYYEIGLEEADIWIEREYPWAILVDQYQQKMLEAIWIQARACLSENDPLDLGQIAEKTKLSLDRVYDNLQILEKAGVICRERTGDHYQMKNIVDKKFLGEMVRRQKLPVKITINPPDSFQRGTESFSPFSTRLKTAEEENISFPTINWDRIDNFEGSNREEKLLLIERVLTADLTPIVYNDGKRQLSVKIPMTGDSEEEIKGTLQFLGIGPEELVNLLKFRPEPETLAAGIRILEERAKKNQLPVAGYGLLLAKIKTAVLSLVFAQEIEGKEGSELLFAEVMELLTNPT